MEEISLREIIDMILKNKKMIILIIIACLVLGPLGAVVFNSVEGQAKAVIAVNFPGIEKGVNPDGSPFNINLLKSAAVIKEAISDIELNELSGAVTQIGNSISITPVIPDSTVAAAENAIKAGKSYEYYPSLYSVTFMISKSLGISKEEGAEILDAVIRNYVVYFNKQFSGVDFLSDSITGLVLNKYDYAEAVEVIESNVDSIKSFLEARISEESDFRTAGTNMSFADIDKKISIIVNVDLENAKSLISHYNLTKNKEMLINNYRYKIKTLEMDMADKENEAEVALSMMKSYERENNLLILPSQIEDKYSIPGTGSYYEVLAEKATLAQIEAYNIGNRIAFYNLEIQRLINDNVLPAEKAAAETETVSKLETVRRDLEVWVASINQVAQEYYNYRYSRLISNISGVNTASNIDFKMIIAVSLLIGLVLGVFAALFKEYWKKSGSVQGAAQAAAATVAAAVNRKKDRTAVSRIAITAPEEHAAAKVQGTTNGEVASG